MWNSTELRNRLCIFCGIKDDGWSKQRHLRGRYMSKQMPLIQENSTLCSSSWQFIICEGPTLLFSGLEHAFSTQTYREFLSFDATAHFYFMITQKTWVGPRQKEGREQREGLKTGQIRKCVEQVCWVNICFTPVLLMLTRNSNTAPLPRQSVPVALAATRGLTPKELC